MGHIFHVMGKSASGKDTIYNMLLADESLTLSGVVLYTTRPMREGEENGRDYNFVTQEQIDELDEAGKIIEKREYNTVHGLWTYATVDDGQIDLSKGNYIVEGVLESYISLKKYYGDAVVPIYIEVDDGDRLLRAISREKQQKTPRYAEMCRRFLTDTQDFSEDKLLAAGITIRYQNNDLDECVSSIKKDILKK